MKKVIGKNQVIITSLAILIAVAGYLNFADVDLGFRDKEASTDSSSILEDAGYDLTDETALLDENQADGGLTDNSLTDSQETDTPGEAVFTGSTGFAAQAKPLWVRSAENRCAHRTRQICRTLSIMKKLMMKRSRRQYIRWSR